MVNRNPKRLSAEVFSSAQKQPKQNASSQNREENGSTTLRNTREKPLLAGYVDGGPVPKTLFSCVTGPWGGRAKPVRTAKT